MNEEIFVKHRIFHIFILRGKFIICRLFDLEKMILMIILQDHIFEKIPNV